MKALSIRPPWAWAILHAAKDVENRTWKTNIRCYDFVPFTTADACQKHESEGYGSGDDKEPVPHGF